MKRSYLSLVLAATAVFGLYSPAFASTSKAQLMILGVAHLEARHDLYNAEFADSPLSPKRQTQVEEVVERLVRFRPTKVLIEAPFGASIWNERYRNYRAGKFELGGNEVYQFGFKLAARAGDASIYPIDTYGPSIVSDDSPAGKRIDAYLSANAKSVKDAAFDAFVARGNAIERDGTYLDLLRFLNTDAAVRANASWYSIMAGMGREANDAGASYVAQWYTRNVFIFSNVQSIVRPGDRVVLIMGQGHKYMLSQLAQLDPNIEYVDVLDYLQ